MRFQNLATDNAIHRDTDLERRCFTCTKLNLPLLVDLPELQKQWILEQAVRDIRRRKRVASLRRRLSLQIRQLCIQCVIRGMSFPAPK